MLDEEVEEGVLETRGKLIWWVLCVCLTRQVLMSLQVVDTTLVRLLAEEGLQDEIVRILDGPNDCVLQQVESSLLDAGLYNLLSSLLLKSGEVSKTLDIWTKSVSRFIPYEPGLTIPTRLVEGIYVDDGFTGGIKKISDLLWKSKDMRQVEKYGIWLLQRDRVLGLKVSPLLPSPLRFMLM